MCGSPTSAIYRGQASPVSSFLSVSLRPRAAISVVSLRAKALQGSSKQFQHHVWTVWPNSTRRDMNFKWNSVDSILEGFLGNYQTFSPTHHSQRIFEGLTTKTRVNPGCMKGILQSYNKLLQHWGPVIPRTGNVVRRGVGRIQALWRGRNKWKMSSDHPLISTLCMFISLSSIRSGIPNHRL